MFVERRLKPTWDWILTVMDATEAQLRFGASLTDSTDSAHPLHPANNAPAATSTSSENTFGFSLILVFNFIFFFYILKNPFAYFKIIFKCPFHNHSNFLFFALVLCPSLNSFLSKLT